MGFHVLVSYGQLSITMASCSHTVAQDLQEPPGRDVMAIDRALRLCTVLATPSTDRPVHELGHCDLVMQQEPGAIVRELIAIRICCLTAEVNLTCVSL